MHDTVYSDMFVSCCWTNYRRDKIRLGKDTGANTLLVYLLFPANMTDHKTLSEKAGVPLKTRI